MKVIANLPMKQTSSAKKRRSTGAWATTSTSCAASRRFIYSGRRPKLTGLPRGARGDWTDVVDRYDELCKTYHDELSELFRVKSEVNGVISRVEDPKLRELLVLRYCRYFSWDRIASTMGYEPRWIHALHARALRCVDHILDQ